MNLVFLVNQLEQHANTNAWREKRKAFVFSGSSLQINESNSVIVLPDSVFNKTIIPLALVGCEMIIANQARSTELAIYHLTSNAHSWNNS